LLQPLAQFIRIELADFVFSASVTFLRPRQL
jgi:hypothetical protein